ncbi:MAG: hypothetical protein M1818_006561 [Claussenomyces sp. TS43310]|nr:MAG: hypothetical protein M1818_006561 [Claussenomyces sp. TS43310]
MAGDLDKEDTLVEHLAQAGGSSDPSHLVTAHGDAIASEALGDNIPPGYFTSGYFLGSSFGCAFACLSGYLGWTLSSNSLAAINEELGPSKIYLWVPLAYIVTSAIGWLLFGRLSDIFGRRWLYIGGNFIALIGAIVAATAPTLNALIASNVLIGLGSAVQLSYGTVVNELVPNKARGYMAAFILFFTTPGAAFGPVIAKAFIAHTKSGWRWNYYLGIITNAIAIILLLLFYHPPTFEMLHIGKSKWEKVKALDYGGMVLFVGGEVLFLMGINWGGGLYAWKSAQVIACIIVGFLLIIAFVLYEAYIPSDPLIPLFLLKNTQFMLFIWFACVGGMLYYALGVVWPTTVATLFTSDLIHQGWLTIASTGGNQLGNVCCGIAFSTIGRVRYQLIAASIICTAFLGALASTTQHTQGRSLAFTIIGTCACGFMEVIPIVSSPLTTRPEDIGLAVGTLGAIRASAGAIATAIYLSILTNKDNSMSAIEIPPAVQAAGLPPSSLPVLFAAIAAGTTQALEAVPGITPQILVALGVAEEDAFSGAVKIVFLATISFGGVAIIASFFIKDIDHLLTNQVIRKLHHRHLKGTHEAVVTDEKRAAQHV